MGLHATGRENFDCHDKLSLVATTVGIQIAMELTLIGLWYQHLVDAEGAFLNGVFEHPEKHKLYVKIPEAYQQWYPPWAVLLLLKTYYGTVQAACLRDDIYGQLNILCLLALKDCLQAQSCKNCAQNNLLLIFFSA